MWGCGSPYLGKRILAQPQTKDNLAEDGWPAAARPWFPGGLFQGERGMSRRVGRALVQVSRLARFAIREDVNGAIADDTSRLKEQGHVLHTTLSVTRAGRSSSALRARLYESRHGRDIRSSR